MLKTVGNPSTRYGNPAPSIPLVAGAVEILRFSAGMYFSGAASGASTVYMTPGEGL